MNKFAKVVLALSAIGLLASAGGASYSANNYVLFSHTLRSLEALTSPPNKMIEVIEDRLGAVSEKSLIIGQFKRQAEESAALHGLSLKAMARAQQHARIGILFCVGSSIIFIVLLLLAYRNRHDM